MLEALLGSKVREKVLLYVLAMGEGYPREIARFFNCGLDPVQKQLRRLLEGGILKSRKVGRTVLYSLDDSCEFIVEMTALLTKVLASACGPRIEELRTVLEQRRDIQRASARYIIREHRRSP